MSGEGRQRIDKWLWHARIVKTRTLAQKLATSGHVRINIEKAEQSSALVHPGDVLTIGLDSGVKVLRILAIGDRRGPAAEARLLYEDLSPPPPPREERPAVPVRDPGAGRPTKRERRALDAAWSGPGEDD